MPFSRERGPVPPPIPFEKHDLPFDQEPELSDDELAALLEEHPQAKNVLSEIHLPPKKEDVMPLNDEDIEEIDDTETPPSIARAA